MRRLNATPVNTGAVQDLNTSNRGCLIAQRAPRGLVQFLHQCQWPGGLCRWPGEHGLRLWCLGSLRPQLHLPPSGPPIRCSWADGAAITGLNYGDRPHRRVFGDGWTRYLDVTAGEWYLLFLDNWYLTGNGFTLTWNLQNGASISCDLTPVELIALTATQVDADVQLNWATGSEVRSSHFLIERSKNGVDFEVIGHVGAAGESNMLTSYEFLDREPHAGLNHYRLAQVDTDGSTKLSKVVTVTIDAGTKPLSVSPNPADDVLEVSFMSRGEGRRNWTIIDPSGRIADSGSLASGHGMNKAILPIRQLEAGSYMLVLEEEMTQVRSTVRFVKR
ncbi:MAG: hypothetical protein R2818_13160 [Flavobacteriales bacterium]